MNKDWAEQKGTDWAEQKGKDWAEQKLFSPLSDTQTHAHTVLLIYNDKTLYVFTNYSPTAMG